MGNVTVQILLIGVLLPVGLLALSVLRVWQSNFMSKWEKLSAIPMVIASVLAIQWTSTSIELWRTGDLVTWGKFYAVYPTMFGFVLCLIFTKELIKLPNMVWVGMVKGTKWIFQKIAGFFWKKR